MLSNPDLRGLAIYAIFALGTYLLGPRTIPTLGEDGTIDLSFIDAILWWVATIAFVIFLYLSIRQLYRIYQSSKRKPVARTV